MSTPLLLGVIGLMFGALVVVFMGLAVMIKGGAVNEKYGNALMRWRIGFQAAAIAAFALYFFSR